MLRHIRHEVKNQQLITVTVRDIQLRRAVINSRTLAWAVFIANAFTGEQLNAVHGDGKEFRLSADPAGAVKGYIELVQLGDRPEVEWTRCGDDLSTEICLCDGGGNAFPLEELDIIRAALRKHARDGSRDAWAFHLVEDAAAVSVRGENA